MSLVIFSHGKESGPQGTKINLLSKVATNLGFRVISIDYRKCKDVNERVALLKKNLHENENATTILVGSSMGGYVSTVVANEIKIEGLFLMCPALYMKNYPIHTYSPQTEKIEIIHGWDDTIVPFENSIRFGKKTQANLHLIEDNHRLSNSHQFIQQLFEIFLQEIKEKSL